MLVKFLMLVVSWLLPNFGERAEKCFLFCKPLASVSRRALSLASHLQACQEGLCLLQVACKRVEKNFLICKSLVNVSRRLFSLASRLQACREDFSLLQAACKRAEECFVFRNHPSRSASQSALLASLGMRQSPRGERLTEPTLGPSGRQLRLNCWVKKRRQKVLSHFRMVSSS